MPLTQRRHSAADLQELRKYLGRKHGIDRPRRASSSMPTSQSTEPVSRFLRWDTVALPAHVRRRIDARTKGIREKETMFTSVRKRWRECSALSRRQLIDLKIKLKEHYESLPWSQPLIDRNETSSVGKKLAWDTLTVSWDIVRTIWSILRIFLNLTWYLLKLPICCVLAALLFLQIVAMAYTIMSTTFLSSFCHLKLPVVRNWICSSHDQFLRESQQRMKPENLNQPLAHLIEGDQKTMAYELPHYLSRYESTIRSYRVSLPETGFTAGDKVFFQEKFTDFIDQCERTIFGSQDFHAHVVGTINTHISNTAYIVSRLDDHGLFSQSKPTESGILANTMAWFNTYYLVWLPVGIGPFQEYSVPQYSSWAISMIEEHVSLMANRLTVDIDLVLALRAGLMGLKSTSEEIGTRLAMSKNDDGYQNYLKDQRLLPWVSGLLFAPTYEDFQLVQRSKWTDTMGPFFKDILDFTGEAAKDLREAYTKCQDLLQRLRVERRAAKYGNSIAEWLKLQAMELDEGVIELKAQLQAFKTERLRFDERVFRQAEGQ
ncbi:MAG: hypothetical protein Q9196_002812 [Gyalolechia fulgens]